MPFRQNEVTFHRLFRSFPMRLIALAAILIFAAPPAIAQRGSVQVGQKLVQANCARCHAVGRTGESPLRIAPPLRELHKRYPVENLAEALAEGIVTGHPTMPEFRFDPDQIEHLIAYLKTLER
jgi:mono/diheme cytochrome c family protein